MREILEPLPHETGGVFGNRSGLYNTRTESGEGVSAAKRLKAVIIFSASTY